MLTSQLSIHATVSHKNGSLPLDTEKQTGRPERRQKSATEETH
jgi:hypothetical protein